MLSFLPSCSNTTLALTTYYRCVCVFVCVCVCVCVGLCVMCLRACDLCHRTPG